MELLQTLKMVLWSLFGVRSMAGAEADEKAFRPGQVITVALVLVLAFVGLLVTIVHTAIGSPK